MAGSDVLDRLVFKDGLGATNHFESNGYIRSKGYPVSSSAYHIR